MAGVFQWGSGGQLEKVSRGKGRVPVVEPASQAEHDDVLDAIEKGQAQIFTSGTSSPYSNRSGAGRVLHQATGSPLAKQVDKPLASQTEAKPDAGVSQAAAGDASGTLPGVEAGGVQASGKEQASSRPQAEGTQSEAAGQRSSSVEASSQQ